MFKLNSLREELEHVLEKLEAILDEFENKYQEIINEIGHLESISKSFTGLESRIIELDNKYDYMIKLKNMGEIKLESGTRVLEEKYETLIKEINKILKIENELTSHKNQLDSLNNKINNVVNRHNENNLKLNQIIDKENELEKRLQSISEEFKVSNVKIRSNLTEVENNINGILKKQGEHDFQLKNAEEKIKNIESELTKLNNFLFKVYQKQEKIEEELSKGLLAKAFGLFKK